MKKHYLFLIGLLAVCFFLLSQNASAVSASATNYAPNGGTNQSADFVASWTFDNATAITDPLTANSTVTWNASGSWVEVTKSGFVCNAGACNMTLAISSMAEGVGALNITLGNETTINTTSVAGSVFRVDKTAPTPTIILTTNQGIKNRDFVITYATSDSGSGIQTTSLTSVRDSSDLSCNIDAISFTDNSATETLTSGQTKCVGNYIITLTTTDYSGLSTTTTSTYNIANDGGGAVALQQQSGQIVTTSQTGGISFFQQLINWFKSLFGMK